MLRPLWRLHSTRAGALARLRLIAASAVAIAAVCLPLALASAETLEDALIAAYLGNPQLLAQRQALRATDEGVSQARAGWRPTVQFTGSGGRLNQSQRSTFATGGAPLTLTTNSDSTLNTESLTLTQPLYLGGRVSAQIDSADAQVEAGRAQLASTEATVLLQAATAFMDVLRDAEVLELNRSNEQVLRRQLEAVRFRFSAGDALESDVAQSEAALLGANADRIQAESNLAASRAAYLRAVGKAPENLTPQQNLPPLPASESEASAVAFRGNPDLLSAVFTERAARRDIDAAASALWPSLSVEVDLSRNEDQSAQGSSTRSAQVLARLSVPLYQSGAEYSQVRQRKDTANQRRLQVDQERAQVQQQVTQGWYALESARAQLARRADQVRAAGIALDAITRQAQYGQSSTLEVLTAQQNHLQAQIALANARHDQFVAAYALRAAIGQLSVQALGLNVRAYDPAAHYRQVRGQLIGTTPKGEK